MRKNVLTAILGLCVAAAAPAAVMAAPVGARSCTFTTGGTLAFGTLNPALGTNVTTTTTVEILCTKPGGGGVQYTINETWSPNYLGGYRLQHATVPTEFIPYTFTYPGQGTAPTGSAAKDVPTLITITGAIQGIDYLNALVGNYSDWVRLDITP